MAISEINNNINLILNEIGRVFVSVNQKEADSFTKAILRAKKIVLIGSGRMGLDSKAFSMRLSHLGLNSSCLGDSNVPSIGKGDLVVIASGSGETQTIYDLSKIARQNKARVFLITANPKSRIGRLADGLVVIKAPTKFDRKIRSVQPMTTLNEQCLQIFYDAIVLMLMKRLKKTHASMWKKHSNLE